MINLIGIGPGGPGGFSVEARETIEKSDLLIGAPRMLSALPAHRGQVVSAYRPEEILSILEEMRPQSPCILFSGDPGFWSGAEALAKQLEEKGMDFQVFPGLSSVQVLASRLGRSWKDWVLLSAHGQDGDLIPHLKQGRPVFLLTGGDAAPALLCRTLADAGLPHLTVTVGEDLGCPGESVTVGTAEELASRSFSPLNVILVDPAPIVQRRSPGIADEEFIRGDTPMTKQEVRAVILAKLAIEPEDVCWDIGAGTGSVSVELAMQSKEVWAVEHDENACELIRQNREKFCAWNLSLTVGTAPEALDILPRPDKVFVGGSKGRLCPILRTAADRNPDLRICVSAVTLETVQEAMDEMDALGLAPEMIQISVSRTRPAGGKHLLLAQNPVFLITGGRP